MRRAAVIVSTVALLVAVLPVLSAPTQAVQLPVRFSATELPTWQTNGIAWAAASANGLVFVGGTFSAIRPPGSSGTRARARGNLAVLDAATGAPTGCAPVVGGTDATVRSLAVSPDGRTLYVGGRFSSVDSAVRQNLAAIDIATCRVVSGFTPLPNAMVRAIAATSARVYFGGSVVSVGGTARARAAAVDAVGTASPGALTSWAPRFDGEVNAIATQPDGAAVVVGGDFTTSNGAASRALAVVNSTNGANVRTYGASFVSVNSTVKAIATDATGFYTGHEGNGGGVFDGRIALSWGSYDQRWRDTCLGATQALAVHAGVLYSGSHAHDCSSNNGFPEVARQHLLAQTTTDPRLLSWFPNTNGGIGESLGPRAMTVGARGGASYLWAVGEFTRVNGTAQQGITRFGATPDTAPSGAVLSLSSPSPGQVRLAVRRAFDRDDQALTYRFFRNGSTTPFRTLRADSQFWDRSQLVVLDTRTAGTTQRYRTSVSDGSKTTTSNWQSIRVASSASRYVARVLADGPTAYWRFGEASNVLLADATSNRGNLTLLGGAQFRVAPAALSGEDSRALNLLAGARATAYSERRYDDPSTYTLETWLRTSTTRGGMILGFGSTQTVDSRYNDRVLYLSDSGRLNFGVRGSSRFVLRTDASVNDGRWHHVVATQGSDGMAIYVDGKQVASRSTTVNGDIDGYWRLGGDSLAGWPNAPTSSRLAGAIDETAVYPRVLSAAQVALHHSLGVSRTALRVTPTRTVYGQRAVASVQVTGGLPKLSGAVTIRSGGTVVGRGSLVNGAARIRLSATVPAGRNALTAHYSGGATHAASSSGSASLTVAKATASVRASLRARALDRSKRGRVRAVVKGSGFVVRGKVKVMRGDRRLAVRTLKDGRATLRLPRLKPGKHRLRVVYNGDRNTHAAKSAKLVLRVRR